MPKGSFEFTQYVLTYQPNVSALSTRSRELMGDFVPTPTVMGFKNCLLRQYALICKEHFSFALNYESCVIRFLTFCVKQESNFSVRIIYTICSDSNEGLWLIPAGEFSTSGSVAPQTVDISTVSGSGIGNPFSPFKWAKSSAKRWIIFLRLTSSANISWPTFLWPSSKPYESYVNIYLFWWLLKKYTCRNWRK